jgi:hypothetical protein
MRSSKNYQTIHRPTHAALFSDFISVLNFSGTILDGR